MNLFVCKARIISTPRLFLYKQKPLVQMLVCLPNAKKGTLWYCIHTKTRGRLAHQIFDTCNKGIFIFIHGSIRIRFKKTYVSKNKFKKKKFLVLNIMKIYPEVIS